MPHRPAPPRSRRAAALLATALLALLASGCQDRRIRVEMTADAGEVVRSFETNELARADAARLAGVYGTGPVRSGSGVRFDGAFHGDLPSELGNRNGIAELPSELGTASFYFEAFGRSLDESHDEWRHLQQRMAAGELWVRLFGRWAARRIPDSERRAAFESYVETALVPTANNVMLMYGSMQATAQSHRVGGRLRNADETGPRSEDERFWQRVFMPLLLSLAIEGDEHAFLTAEEAQVLLLIANDGRAGGDRRDWSVETIFLRAIERQVQRFRPDIERLSMPQLVGAGISFYLYANASPDRDDLLLASPAIPEADKERVRNGDRFIALPPPYGIQPRGRPESTRAEVRLGMRAEPYLTNGRWDAAAGQVVFDTSFYDARNRTVTYQPVFYAAWSVPAASRQRTLFGGVLLAGETLADYCLWEHMLAPDERIRWSEALLELERDGWSDTLRSFAERDDGHAPPAPLAAWILGRAREID